MGAEARARLSAELARHPRLAVAVSGGVDSLTLAHLAAQVTDAVMIHAASPAVPAEATARVRAHAAAHGLALIVTDAGEFADPRYRANPHDRCYFCKSNLYGRIAGLSDRTIASGANLDDLGDYRPGLLAAAERAVVHPYIAAGMGKAAVRALAADLGLHDVAELPAQPCLASRIETGLPIRADDLAFVHAVETAARAIAPDAADLRCRVLHAGVVLEVDEAEGPRRAALSAAAAGQAAAAGRPFLGLRPYRRGSAFLRPAEGSGG